MTQTIFTALGPNYQSDDVALAAQLLIQPWRWQSGPATTNLEQQFCQLFGASAAASFATGRGALWTLLAAMRIQPGDEVLLQAYTCVAVAEPIIWHDATPVYVDVDAVTANMSVEDLERKITNRSKVLIIQHTFGLPADIDELISIARRHNLLVIEDCAHALGARYRGQLVGTFGDAAFFSFGRDKVISSVFGGMAVVHTPELVERFVEIQSQLPLPAPSWTLQQLLHPIIISLVKVTYDTASIGKLILRACQRAGIISKAVYPEERRGGRPAFVVKRLPNALALFALHQVKKIEAYNHYRQMIAHYYTEALTVARAGEQGIELPATMPDREHIFLRYLLCVNEPEKMFATAKSAGIILGDWYTTPIAPADVDCVAIQYQRGSCPVAERLAERSINLPTHIGITREIAQRIVHVITEQV